MFDGEYAKAKYLWLHRYLSLGVLILGAVIFYFEAGSAFAVRRWAIFVYPLTFIWFAEQLGSWAVQASGHWLNSSNADTALRFFGWILLITILLIKLLPIIVAS